MTLGTKNIKDVTIHSLQNQIHYATKHGYSFIAYDDTMVPFDIVTWNKVFVIQKHLDNFEWVMWIDSDAIFTNMNITINEIIKSCDKDMIIADDIGGWKMNTGVMFWKNTDWSKNILNKWCNMRKISHAQGAEQQQLIHLLENESNFEIKKRNLFNSHPDEHKSSDFILHMMGKSSEERKNKFIEFSNF